MDNSIIKTEHLVKRYNRKIAGNATISDCTISINKGEFCVIMGNSGSGKSTLLYLLSGLDSPDSGKIWINGTPVHSQSQAKLAILRRKTIGFIFQDNNLVPNLTIRENILVSGYLLSGNRKSVNKYADQLMEELDILPLAKRFPSEVSGGELQRAAIARGCINRPLILFADEPTGNLNSEASEKVLDCFSVLHRKGQTVVMVTHDLKSACRGSRVLFLKDGNIPESHYYTSDNNVSFNEDELFSWLKKMGW